MSNAVIAVSSNRLWETVTAPLITVITPVFNRRATIMRTIQSVENQTFRDIEYIIIDDGSTETIDDLVEGYLKQSTLPVMYIKKENGGVHTARNAGYRAGRGKLVLCIDSDDELLPNACEIFSDAWRSIPPGKREWYWQMKALCIDENGNITSDIFPDDINTMEPEATRRYFSAARGEQIGCRVLDILRNNPFPEPEGVTFVSENILWLELENRYLSWGLNVPVRVYHTEGDNRLSNTGKKTMQSCRNALWNARYALCQPEIYLCSFYDYLEQMMRFCVMRRILQDAGDTFPKQHRLSGGKNALFQCLLYIPSLLVARIYKRRRMS